jgi:hypothetical protein
LVCLQKLSREIYLWCFNTGTFPRQKILLNFFPEKIYLN